MPEHVEGNELDRVRWPVPLARFQGGQQCRDDVAVEVLLGSQLRGLGLGGGAFLGHAPRCKYPLRHLALASLQRLDKVVRVSDRLEEIHAVEEHALRLGVGHRLPGHRLPDVHCVSVTTSSDVAVKEDVLNLGLCHAAGVVHNQQLARQGISFLDLPVLEIIHNGRRVRAIEDVMHEPGVSLVHGREAILGRLKGRPHGSRRRVGALPWLRRL
mmetsp:Transcript_46722/g.99804  ORF Transcript_46722/g.99804 Transcript_46722/m.99804 type:complete len:213 (-) Transcript_46722:1021-1659(-)